MEVTTNIGSLDDLLTIREAEEQTGIPGRTLRSAAQRGVIASQMVHGRHLVHRDSLRLYARTHRRRSPGAVVSNIAAWALVYGAPVLYGAVLYYAAGGA